MGTVVTRVLDGYTPFDARPPFRDRRVLFFEERTGQKWLGTAKDLHPGYDTRWLWWTVSGIESVLR